MPTKRILPDKDFEQIIIRTNRRIRNVTMRVKPDGLYVTVPPRSRSSEVIEWVNAYRESLLEKFEQVRKRPIDAEYRIDAPCFKLSLAPGRLSFFSIKVVDEAFTIYYPPQTDFSSEDTQRLLRNAILRALKKRAAQYLPPLLDELADMYHFTYKRVKITGSKSRWGSCSATGSINLSCYLLLLPSHLIDYVLLHELCHTKEMNHGPEFREILNQVTDGLAKQLRKEMKNHRADF